MRALLFITGILSHVWPIICVECYPIYIIVQYSFVFSLLLLEFVFRKNRKILLISKMQEKVLKSANVARKSPINSYSMGAAGRHGKWFKMRINLQYILYCENREILWYTLHDQQAYDLWNCDNETFSTESHRMRWCDVVQCNVIIFGQATVYSFLAATFQVQG